jgi:superfamily II DNA or RNA helicase
MLRPYQEACLDAVLKEYMAGTRQMLAVLATGTGKTVIAAQLPTKLAGVLPKKMLFIAHRTELISQAVDKIQTWNPTLRVGIEMADKYADPACDVVVACVASIGRENSKRMDRLGWDNFDKIVIDEVHHVLGSTYLKVLEDAGALKQDSTKMLLGITATPRRHNLSREQRKEMVTLDNEDIISLKSVFKKIVFTYNLRTAIKEKYLVPLVGFKVKTETSLDDVKTTAGDFQVDALSDVVNTPARNALIVKAWKEHAGGRQTAAFTCNIKHAKDLAEVFMHNGVLAQPIWGDDPQRSEKLKWHAAGQVTVLCNCALLTEGWDEPTVSCIVQARPTKSSTLFTQIIGRGTRLHPGKDDCIILDMVDNHTRCSLVTFPSLLGLNPEMDLRGESITAVVEKIEALEEKNPGIDFKNLTDLSRVKAYVEALDLFADPYPTEVKEYSQLAWMSQADGSYIISVPEERSITEAKQYWNYRHEKLVLTQNQLEEWELSITSVDPEKKLGVFHTLPEAFTTADEVLQRCRPNRVKLMQRHAGWHDATASNASKKYLAKLVGKRAFIYCTCPVSAKCSGVPNTTCGTCGKQQMNAGQIALAINKMKAVKSK